MFFGTSDLKLAPKWILLLPTLGIPALLGNWGNPLQRVVCWEPPARALPVISSILRRSCFGRSEFWVLRFYPQQEKSEGVSDLLARWNCITGKVMCSSCTITSWDKPCKREKWWAVSCSGCPGLLLTVSQCRSSLFSPKPCSPLAGCCGWHRDWRL